MNSSVQPRLPNHRATCFIETFQCNTEHTSTMYFPNHVLCFFSELQYSYAFARKGQAIKRLYRPRWLIRSHDSMKNVRMRGKDMSLLNASTSIRYYVCTGRPKKPCPPPSPPSSPSTAPPSPSPLSSSTSSAQFYRSPSGTTTHVRSISKIYSSV